MDSVTQILLGASTAALVAPAGHRRRALLLGAALGTLPDLDVLIRYGDPVKDFTFHRGFSHSLLVLPWVAVALWGLLLAAWPQARAHRWRWLFAFQLALLTHPLLDACTVYGTQLFWPLDEAPVMIGSIFIIDPLYTIWLLVGAIAAWRLREHARAGFWLGTGLFLSTAYLGWSLYAQWHIEHAARLDLAKRGVIYDRLLVVPAPLNTVAWRIVVIRPDGDYHEGWFSFLAGGRDISLQRYPGRRDLLQPLHNEWDVQRLRWFTRGHLAAEQIGDRVVIKDLRMGEEGAYVFRFVVGEQRDGRIVPVPAEQLPWPLRADRAQFERLWRLIRSGS
jgi:inner membrane protein